MNFLVINTQAFGDALLGTHIATLIKNKNPQSNVMFAVPDKMWLTTSSDGALDEVLEVLAIQNGIDCLAVRAQEGDKGKYKVVFGHDKAFTTANKIYQQQEWWSDLGFARSAMIDFYIDNYSYMVQEYVEGKRSSDFIDTELKFNVNKTKELPSHLRICVAGPMDWDRKYGKNPEIHDVLVKMQQEYPEIEILMLGRDISPVRLLTALQALNDSHLYIGPNGSLAIAAAGLGVDTIILKDIFPVEYDCPSSYHSGNHYHIGASPDKHCGTYPCITPKYFKEGGPRQWGNPKTEFGFWTFECPYMPDGQSCIKNVETNNIYETFKMWYEKHGRHI